MIEKSRAERSVWTHVVVRGRLLVASIVESRILKTNV